MTARWLYGRAIELGIPSTLDLPAAPAGSNPELVVTASASELPDSQVWPVWNGVRAQLTGPHLRIVVGEGVPPRLLEHVVLDHAIPQALSRLGLVVLHGSGAERAGHAVVLLGRSGSGKSTTAGYLATQGWRLLADDAVVVTHDGPSLIAHASYPGLRLHDDMAGAFSPHAADLPVVTELGPKRRVQLSDAWSDQPARIHALVELDPGGDPGLHRVSGTEAVAVLVRSAFQADVAGADVMARLDRLLPIAEALPIHRLGIVQTPAGLIGADRALRALVVR